MQQQTVERGKRYAQRDFETGKIAQAEKDREIE